MNAAPCAPARLGYTSIKRLRNAYLSGTRPDSCGIFMPEIRLDSAVSFPLSGGWRDAQTARPRAALKCSFSDPPASRPSSRFLVNRTGNLT